MNIKSKTLLLAVGFVKGDVLKHQKKKLQFSKILPDNAEIKIKIMMLKFIKELRRSVAFMIYEK